MAQEHQRGAQRAAGIREPKMHVAYVLRLGADENGVHTSYVGSSCNFMNRLHNHIEGNDLSSAWVRRWGYEELRGSYPGASQRGSQLAPRPVVS